MLLPFVAELNRRRVFRALIVYGVFAFGLLQIIEPVMHGMHWPDSVLSYVVVALAFGFPAVVGLAWAFDVKAGRIERSIAAPGAPRLHRVGMAVLLVGIGALASTPGLSWYFLVRGREKAAARSTSGSTAMPAASIAVLPFANLSSDKEQEYFADGIAEEILNALAQVEGLHVCGRTSSFSFKGKNEDLRMIGEKLNIANVLEGSVRKDGNRVRVTAQLVAVATGYHLWSKTFDREMTGIFAIQDEIATSVADALKLKLLGGRGATRTANLDAYDEYLLGQQLFARGSKDGARLAIQAYEKALALDPKYAPAWAGLSLARVFFGTFFAESVPLLLQTEEQALVAAERAIALDPKLAQGYQARGRIRSVYQLDWRGAQSDLERAIALKPAQPAILNTYANLLASIGRLREAIEALRRAADLDPLRAGTWASLGVMYRNSNQLELARAATNKALEIAPDHVFAACLLSEISLLEGEPTAALASYEHCRLEYQRLVTVSMAHHDVGESRKSQEALDKLLAGFSQIGAYQIAQVYAWRNEPTPAFEWLDRARAQYDSGLESFKSDPFLRNLRRDSRYTALLKSMNLPLD